MRVDAVELRRVALPLRSPFRTSFGTETDRDILLVKVYTESGIGWGECVAGSAPLYSAEYVAGAHSVVKEFMAPLLLDAGDMAAADVASLLGGIKGNRMAKAALELAVLDAELRAQQVSLGRFLGSTRDRVECGVSVGIHEDVGDLLRQVEGFVSDGYRRIKLKIEPGWDVAPVAAARQEFGPEIPLQVDANTAYMLEDVDHLRKLDEFGLLLIEQPFGEDDIAAHAVLARSIETPVCLDESITSAASAVDAIERGACSIVNIKAGRVGGYLEARKVHDVCADRGVAVWCGGMLETGIGRAANVALASLPNFTLPGDTSASGRYYERDVTEPFVLRDGMLDVPAAPGIGVDPLPEMLADTTVQVEVVRRGSR